MLTQEQAEVALATVRARYDRLKMEYEAKVEQRETRTMIVVKVYQPGRSKRKPTILEWDAEHLDRGPTAYRVRTSKP